MDLILWRHAEAQDPAEGMSDLERALTGRGRKQAERAAQWLNHRLPHRVRVLASPARRTQETAQALQRSFRTVEAVAPGASAQDLLAAARWPQSSEPVLVVGHQPTLGEVAALLLGAPDLAWSVKKGAVWWLRHRAERGAAAQTVLLAVLSPELM